VSQNYHYDDLVAYYAVTQKPFELRGKALYTLHAHEEYELYYFLRGNCTYLVEGSIYPLSPGSIMIMRPAEIHCINLEGDNEYERLSIRFSQKVISAIDPNGLLLAPYLDRPLGKGNLYPASQLSLTTHTVLMRMFSQTREMDEYERRLLILSGLVTSLEEIRDIFLKRNSVPMDTKEPETVGIELLRYVNTHLETDLSLDTLSAHFFLSKSQINRKFKKLTGTSAGEYINTKRILYARQRIMEDGISARQACNEVGYSDYSSFYRAYKKKYGTSPGQK